MRTPFTLVLLLSLVHCHREAHKPVCLTQMLCSVDPKTGQEVCACAPSNYVPPQKGYP